MAGTSGRSQDVVQSGNWRGGGNRAIGECTGEVDAAIAAAKAALPGWASTPPAKRAQVMFKFRDLIIRDLDKLAGLISAQHGKTLDDARGEVARGLEVVEFACGIPHLLKGEYSAQVANALLTAILCVSQLVWSPALPRLIFRQWCRCGCFRWRLPAATHLF